MSHLTLSLMALTERDVSKRRVSTLTVPSMEIDVRSRRIVDNQEMDKVRAMMEDARYDKTVLLSNFDAKIGYLAPPTGYVSTMHEDTTFCASCFDRHLFRGIAVTSLTRSRKWGTEDINEAMRNVNVYIRDVSPRPLKDLEDNRWVASLGPFAWIGLYEQRKSGLIDAEGKEQRTRGTNESKYAVVVVAGMDDAAYASMWKLMNEMDGKVSMKEAFERLQPYKKHAEENRRRLLWTFTSCLKDEVSSRYGSRVHEHSNFAYERIKSSSSSSQLDSDVAKWLPESVPVPTWYKLPVRNLKHCHPIPEGRELYDVGSRLNVGKETPNDIEMTPKYVIPEYECVMDDVKFSSLKKMIRYASCTNAKEGIVTVRGPLQTVVVEKPHNPDDVRLFATHDGWHSQYPQKYGTKGSSIEEAETWTWEDASLEKNRLVESSFEVLDGTNDKLEFAHERTEYEPCFVRVSMMDSYERVFPDDPFSDRKRMTGFCSDGWKSVVTI